MIRQVEIVSLKLINMEVVCNVLNRAFHLIPVSSCMMHDTALLLLGWRCFNRAICLFTNCLVLPKTFGDVTRLGPWYIDLICWRHNIATAKSTIIGTTHQITNATTREADFTNVKHLYT